MRSLSQISIEKLLLALSCPFNKDINLNDDKHYITLIRWLEDRIIREYEISERQDLHLRDNSLDNLMQWGEHFNLYLQRLMCPFKWTKENNFDCLYWLLSLAISITYDETFDTSNNIINETYNDDMNHFKQHTNEEESISAAALEISTTSYPKSSIIYETEQISTKLIEIGIILKIARYDEESMTAFLHRIYQKIKFQYPNEAINFISSSGGDTSSHIAMTTSFPLGFDCNDPVLNQVALVLKMLYLSDFRELQTEINALLVLVQEYTANPKLNSSLGKVGY